MDLPAASARIRAASSLDGLARTLNEIDADTQKYLGDELAQLPTFGGPEPSDTSDLFSWDEGRFLVADGARWSLIDRTEAEWLPEYATSE